MANIDFKLFPSQSKVLNSQSEVTVLLAGRGTGKSTIACHWVFRRMVEKPDVLGFIGTPSHGQTNELMTKLVSLLADLGIPYVIGKMPPASWNSMLTDHKQYLSVMLPNHNKCTQIRFATLENFEACRGISIGWMLIDEAALIREVAYKEVLLPALRGYGQDHKYQQLLLTTPKGVSNWVSEIIENPKVEVIRAASKENFIEFPETKIEELRGMMSDRQFRQEIMGEIINLSERSMFHAFGIQHCKKKELEGARWAIASDQNISPQIAVILKYTADEVYAYDEIYIEGGSTVADMVAALAKKEYLKDQSVYLFGDRSGNNRSLVSDTSYYSQLITRCSEIGISLIDKTLRKNPPIYESRELVNAWFEKNKLFINPDNKHLIQDLEKAQYTEDFKTDKRNYDPHMCDALAYFFWKEFGGIQVKIKSNVWI